jgi:alpha-L-arabinofuranosidase
MATRDARRKRVCVTVVNCEAEAQRRTVALDGLGDIRRVRITAIAGESLSAVNSFAWKDHIKPVTREVKPSALRRMDFAPYSVTAIVIEQP